MLLKLGVGQIVANMRSHIITHRILRNRAFRISLIAGFSSCLLDLDHIATFGHPQRWLHLPFLIISSVVLCCLGTYLAGLYIKMVLRRRRGKT